MKFSSPKTEINLKHLGENYLSYPKARSEQVKKLELQIAFILLPYARRNKRDTEENALWETIRT
jgi:hypothetical protein